MVAQGKFSAAMDECRQAWMDGLNSKLMSEAEPEAKPASVASMAIRCHKDTGKYSKGNVSVRLDSSNQEARNLKCAAFRWFLVGLVRWRDTTVDQKHHGKSTKCLQYLHRHHGYGVNRREYMVKRCTMDPPSFWGCVLEDLRWSRR